MRWLGAHPFHTLLLLTEKPGQWTAWQIAPIPLLLGVVSALIWARTTGQSGLGWAVSLGLLAFALADWGLLAILPRKGLSFGAVQPPFLGLTVFRWVLALAAATFADSWPCPTLISLALVQLAIWVLAAYGMLLEPFRLQVTQFAISTTKLGNPGKPLRIVHLSDLHVERLARRERALPALIANLEPDLIVLTGDFLNTSYNQDAGALTDLRTLLEQMEAPAGMYAVWGTAEVDLPSVLHPLLAGLGIVVLEDQAVEVMVHGHHLWLMGLSCTRDLAAAEDRLRTLLANAPLGALTILLYHTPDLMPRAAALDVDLLLAGHTHGGQWRVPGFGAILTSSRYWKRYEAGHYRQGDTHLYVSRGLGMEGYGTPRARFFCPPEVVAIALSGPEGQR